MKGFILFKNKFLSTLLFFIIVFTSNLLFIHPGQFLDSLITTLIGSICYFLLLLLVNKFVKNK